MRALFSPGHCAAGPAINPKPSQLHLPPLHFDAPLGAHAGGDACIFVSAFFFSLATVRLGKLHFDTAWVRVQAGTHASS